MTACATERYLRGFTGGGDEETYGVRARRRLLGLCEWEISAGTMLVNHVRGGGWSSHHLETSRWATTSFNFPTTRFSDRVAAALQRYRNLHVRHDDEYGESRDWNQASDRRGSGPHCSVIRCISPLLSSSL